MRQPVIVGAGSALGPIKPRDKIRSVRLLKRAFVSMTLDHRSS